MNTKLNFTPKDWERIKRDWTAWWHHDIDRPMVGEELRSRSMVVLH